VIRSTKGNTGVVLSAYAINCPLLGLVCYSRYNIWTDMNLGESWSYVVATGVIHAVYLIAVALAYQNGNMSIIYPVARGTGVAGTAVLSVPLLGARLSPAGLTGVAAVVLGIFVVGLQASCRKKIPVNGTGETRSVLGSSLSETESDDESDRESFVRGSAIAQAKSLERKHLRYGDRWLKQQLDSSQPNAAVAPSLGTSMLWAMVVAATIVGYATLFYVPTTQPIYYYV
jgi:multidrug transporter EmrE-like cation transporter